eukprot:scaffold95_cov109-Isochrysis_galbana.AAC.1
MYWVRLRFPEGLRSARSMAAGDAQPSGCRGVQAGVQTADSSRCALRWQVRGRRASRARAAGLQCT